MSAPLTCIDLFCGCGGFTLGMQRAGFQILAAIDFNSEAVATLKANLREIPHALERDLTAFAPAALAQLIGTHHVDVIVGGPPCQGFSNVRRVDGSNHGARLKDDPRRHLYHEFLRYVDFFQPSVFVMENVLGIRTAAGGEYFTRVQVEARALGYRVHAQVENAEALGVPQKRRRQLIIGVRSGVPGYFLPGLKPAPRAKVGTLLGHAISDLPMLAAGEGCDERSYDYNRRERHVVRSVLARNYLGEVLEVDLTDKLTNHVARPHSDRDLRDFAKLAEGDNSAAAMKRGVAFEFPYDKSTFKDRYTRQHRERPCSTIVAHLSKDGLMFIHPTQQRSLTPREAARIQSFPDWYRFPAARTHAFRLIGNAVPPLIGEAVGLKVKEFLREAPTDRMPFAGTCDESVHSCKTIRHDAQRSTREACAPRSHAADARELEHLAQLDRRALRTLPIDEFLRGWHSLLFLFPGLHPDNALDHGDTHEPWPDAQLVFPDLGTAKHRRYIRSGWPVALDLIGKEAWRRYEAGELGDRDFYCTVKQQTGLAEKVERDGVLMSATHVSNHLKEEFHAR